MAEAAERAAKIFRSDYESWSKTPGDIVTEADYELDALLKERLLGARPDYGWLSEETADKPGRLQRSRVWVVDSIDGTRDFLRGRTGWAISVALVEECEPVLAALTAPERGELYYAERGQGAELNGARLRVADCAALDGCRVPADPGWTRAGTARVTQVAKPNSLALRLAMLATGAADAVFQTKVVREIDVAAAALIAAEAGALVTDREGAPLRFNKRKPVFPGLVAAGSAGVHAELLEALRGS